MWKSRKEMMVCQFKEMTEVRLGTSCTRSRRRWTELARFLQQVREPLSKSGTPLKEAHRKQSRITHTGGKQKEAWFACC